MDKIALVYDQTLQADKPLRGYTFAPSSGSSYLNIRIDSSVKNGCNLCEPIFDFGVCFREPRVNGSFSGTLAGINDFVSL